MFFRFAVPPFFIFGGLRRRKSAQSRIATSFRATTILSQFGRGGLRRHNPGEIRKNGDKSQGFRRNPVARGSSHIPPRATGMREQSPGMLADRFFRFGKRA